MRGQTVSHYRILGRLDQGGMGEVYLCEDTRLHRKVALKFPHPRQQDEAAARRRFLREAQAAAALTHPHICAIYEIGQADDQTFIVMEYIDGRTLKALIQEGPIDPREAVRIAIAVAEALEAAHRLRIVHRDVKPSNVMVTEQGHVKVVDFGLAKTVVSKNVELATTSITEPGVAVGTVAYMSPEQLMGRRLDGRSDLFSLGVVLYEMITGIQPFRRSTPLESAQATLNTVPPPLGRYREGIPELLEHVVRKMLAKERSNRCRSGREAKTDLAAVFQDSGSGGTDPTPRPVQHRGFPWLASVRYGLAVALVLLATWLSFWLFRNSVQAHPKSIAVLPFVSLSPEPDTQYFTLGMTEDIIAHLSKIRDLRVMSPASVAHYEDPNRDPRAVGRELDVAALLRGSVRRFNGQVRIGVELMDARTLVQIWASTYDRELREIFEIQSDVARKIAEAMEAELSAREGKRIDKPPTGNLTAYDLYLKGREYYSRYRLRDNENAAELFRKAIDLDSNFAAAYAGLADSHVRRHYQFAQPIRWVHEAVKLSEKALSVDAECAEAHKSLGFAYAVLGWQEKALRAYHQAVALSPNYHPAIANIAVILEEQGRFDEALNWSLRNLELNPTAAISHFNMGDIYWDLHDTDEAEKWFLKALDLQPDYVPAGAGLVAIMIFRGDWAVARAWSERLLQASPRNATALLAAGNAELFSGQNEAAEQLYRRALADAPNARNWLASLRLGQLLRRRGKNDEAGQLLSQIVAEAQVMIDNGSDSWRPRWILALVKAVEGDREGAMAWLQSARDSGWRPSPLDGTAPEYEDLRGERRFQMLMAALNDKIVEMRRRVTSKPR